MSRRPSPWRGKRDDNGGRIHWGNDTAFTAEGIPDGAILWDLCPAGAGEDSRFGGDSVEEFGGLCAKSGSVFCRKEWEKRG